MSTFEKEIEPFGLMYEGVEYRLEWYVDNPVNPDRLSDSEKDWFNFLIENFRAEFDEWPKDEKLRPYFDHFLGRPKPYRAMGGAYLHIAYDLPRVIADSLAPERTFNDDLDFGRARGIYLQQTPTFFKVIEEYGTKMKIFGPFALINFLISWINPRLSLAGVMGSWILALRTTAWVHGEILHDSTSEMRRNLEKNLRSAVIEATREVSRSRWNVLEWPRRLTPQRMLKSPPAILSVVLFLQAAGDGSGGTGEPSFFDQLRLLLDQFLNQVWLLLPYLFTAVVAVTILGAVAYLLFSYAKAVAWADYLGEAIYYRVGETIVETLEAKREQ